jgi:signal transduction histidine kinase/DNA-binding NarL/FixJ family response regulator
MTESVLQRAASILLVDDVPANLMAMEAVLQPLGQRIVSARSGQEALRALLEEEFAVILLDVTMPGMDGFETAQLIRDRNKTRGVPIIFLTAMQGNEQFILRAYERGAVDYLIKPFDPDILRAKVSVFVELYLMRERVKQIAALEASQRESEGARERLFEMLMQLPMAMAATIGPDHVIELANPWFDKLAGRRRQLIGRKMLDVFDDLINGEPGELDEVFRTGEPVTQHQRPLSLVGTNGVRITRYVNYSVQPFRLHDGTVGGLIVCGSDVTAEVLARENERIAQVERERLLVELQAALHTRDDFLMVASHELRTPLTSLQLTASSVLRQMDRADGHPLPAPLLNDRMRTVKRQLDRLEQLINALLDVSRLGVGRLELQLEQVDLVEVANDVLARLRDEAARQNVSLCLEAPQSVVGTWDRSRVDQILTNLVTNAIKYGQSKPVDICLVRDGDSAQVRVVDRGIGVPAEQQERIFGKFERAASQRNYGGLGLGLWITRELVGLMHGRVRVESSPGQGATFVVSLPCTHERDVEHDRSATATSSR